MDFNQDRISGFLREFLPIIGTVLVALGWFTEDQVEHYTQLVMQIVGPLVIIAGFIWSWVVNSKAAIVNSTAAMPEVAEIVLTKASPADQSLRASVNALAEATPANVTILR